MFALKTPCADCPWRSDVAPFISPERAVQFISATAFQCHKTINYRDDDPNRGDRPMQCAGLMILLRKSGLANQIMQIGERLGAFAPNDLDMAAPVYETVETAIRAFGGHPNLLLPPWLKTPPATLNRPQ